MAAFRSHVDPSQGYLLPPSPRDWLPEDHLVWFISEAVDDEAQIIVGQSVEQSASDAHYLVPAIDQIAETLGEEPSRVLADPGYRSEAAFEELASRKVDAYVAIGRDGKPPPKLVAELPRTRAMLDKLQTKDGRAHYKRRKCVVETAFAWIKSILGFRTFSLRGLRKVRAEWDLVCAAVNLRRMAPKIAWR